MTDPALQIPELIQSATVRRDPSPHHDLNPSTAASEKRPVVTGPASDAGSIPSDIVDPSRVIRPVRRRQTLPPMPDLRFEQSYLASIKDAHTWKRVAWITVRDQVRLIGLSTSRKMESSKGNNYKLTLYSLQVLLPLLQGTVWTLALSGWRFWNRNASLSGQTLGSRIRRWWYEVNNWKVPPLKDQKLAAQVKDVSTSL